MSTIDPGAGVGAPADSQSAPGSGGIPASPVGGGVAAPPAAPAQQPVDQLRQAYEQTKAKYEPYEKLGAKPEELQRSHQIYQQISTEALRLGEAQGYPADEVREALAKDPIETLRILRQAAQDAEKTEKPLTRAEAERIADQRAKKLLEPYEQAREQELETRAERTFDGDFDRQLKTSFPNGLPESNEEALRGLAWKLLTDNKDGYGALRSKGDTAAVSAAFEQAKKTLLKIVSDFGEHEKKRIGGEPPPQQSRQQTPSKGRSFREIAMALNDDSVPLDKALGR